LPLPPGDVVLKDTWEKCLRPDGAYDGKAVAEEDVLELQRGGTGFAAHDEGLRVGAHTAASAALLAHRAHCGCPVAKLLMRVLDGLFCAL
jgi:hypothetical protein